MAAPEAAYILVLAMGIIGHDSVRALARRRVGKLILEVGRGGHHVGTTKEKRLGLVTSHSPGFR
jgi:hypothetical protein